MRSAGPYLIGFHPKDSLVLVGLRERRVVVTARLDLADTDQHGALEHAVGSMARGGARSVIAVVYPPQGRSGRDWSDLARRVGVTAGEVDCSLSDALLVRDGRWWSLVCDGECCPPECRPLEKGTSAFEAFATFEGLVVRPDRDAVEALLIA